MDTMQKMNKDTEKMLLQKIDDTTARTTREIANLQETHSERIKMIMTVTKNDIDRLNSNINNMRESINGIRNSLIETKHALKRIEKDNTKLEKGVNRIQNKLSKRKTKAAESKAMRSDKVKLWTEKTIQN